MKWNNLAALYERCAPSYLARIERTATNLRDGENNLTNLNLLPTVR
jgi:hypothetical protein